MTDPSAGLAPANSAQEPAWVRHGSSQVQQDYQVALGFEDMLLQQLSSALASSETNGEEGAGGEGEGEGSQPSMGGNMVSSLMPQALSQGVMSGGGFGLAEQLTRQMEGVQGTAATSDDTAQQTQAAASAEAQRTETVNLAGGAGTQQTQATGGVGA